MNLTYVFGAGASANALPIVKNMRDRIGVFIDHFCNSGLLNDDEKRNLKEIVGQISSHYTIDNELV